VCVREGGDGWKVLWKCAFVLGRGLCVVVCFLVCVFVGVRVCCFQGRLMLWWIVLSPGVARLVFCVSSNDVCMVCCSNEADTMVLHCLWLCVFMFLC